MFSAAASSSYMIPLGIEAEISLLNIKLLCEARIRYHDELLKFIKVSNVDEIKKNYAQIYKMFEDPKCFNCKDEEIKDFLNHGIQADANRYQEILDSINRQAPSQKILDYIHFMCGQNLHVMRSNEDLEAKELQRLKKKHNSKHKVKNIISAQVSRGYRESLFWKEAVDILDTHISTIQRNFTQDFKVEDIGQGLDHLLALRSKGFLRLKKANQICQLIGKKAELVKELTTFNAADDFLSNDSMASLRWSVKFKHEFTPWVKRINDISRNLGESLPFSWELYREVHEIYDNLKKLFSELLEEERKRQKLEIPSKKPQAKSLQSEEMVPTASNKDAKAQIETSNQQKLETIHAALEIPELDATLAAEESEESKLLTEYRENEKRKTAEYKLHVELKRQAKRQRLLKTLAAQGNLNSATEPEALNLSNRKNAFSLLLNLNKNNFLLMRTLFETPTPHCQIKYQAIENLFGYEPGKLPGVICGEDKGGSHRKIIIHNTIGYFDVLDNTEEVSASSSATTTSSSSTTTGPLWKPHMPGHESKMPSIAIRMICGTLEQVGINKQSLELFLAAKERLDKGTQKIDLDKLLDSAHLLENYQTKMTFLLGLHQRVGNESLVRQTFAPSFEAELSAEQQLMDKENKLSAIKNIFSYL